MHENHLSITSSTEQRAQAKQTQIHFISYRSFEGKQA
jgi:hypothetical protein